MFFSLFFQDPMSHRIIEKRRRDRMNNCLADLSRLVPTNYLKKVSIALILTLSLVKTRFSTLSQLQDQQQVSSIDIILLYKTLNLLIY